MRINRRRFGKLMGGIPGMAWVAHSSSGFEAPPKTNVPQAGPPDKGGRRPWYETNRRWILLNIHLQPWDPVIASRLNSTEVIDNVLAANANAFMLGAGDLVGNAYYPTRIGHMHPNLKERDFVPKVVTGLKAKGVAVVLYYCVLWNKYAGEHHPEWTMRDNQNREIGDDFVRPALCFNSGCLDYVKGMTSELLEYDPDGLFFDMLWYDQANSCYCLQNCQPLFRKKYGIEMPLSPTWDDAWRKFLEFRYWSSAHFAEELTAHARRQRPKVSVGYNYFGYPPMSWAYGGMEPVRHRLISDYGFAETQPNGLGGQWRPSLQATFVGGLKPGTAALMADTRCTYSYSDFTIKTETDLRGEVFTYLGHGTSPCVIDDCLADGSLQPQFYQRLGRVYDEAKRKEEYFGHERVREVGLYYSLKSRDWYGREKPEEQYQNAFVGAHSALAEAHIPVDALFDESITLERLRSYPVIFLCNTAILDEDEVRLFRDYVRGGGRLLATQDTGLYDRNGNPLPDFALADVLGIRYKGRAEFHTHYFSLPEGVLSADMPPNWDVLVLGPGNVVEAAGAEALGELKIAFYDGLPFHPISNGFHNNAWKSVGPAVFLHRFGQGRTAYAAFGPDLAYAGKNYQPEHRVLIRNLVRHLYAEPKIKVDAPLSTEVIMTEDKASRRYILHFIGYHANRGHSGRWTPFSHVVTEEEPLYRARIWLQEPARDATSLSQKTQIKREGNIVSLQIEEVHEAVIISY